MKKAKSEVITFKADAGLLAAMKGIPNRSAFIRASILAALESACPLCQGAGFLTARQKMHWERFAALHRQETCGDCHVHLVCEPAPARRAGGRRV